MALYAKNTKTGEWEELPSSRRGKIVFTDRPLSELIEIGYLTPLSEGWEKGQDIYVKFYKDICWEMFKEGGNRSIISNERFYIGVNGVSTEWGSYKIEMIDSDKIDSDTAIIKMNLPQGTFLLRFRNPVTGEEMDITLDV